MHSRHSVHSASLFGKPEFKFKYSSPSSSFSFSFLFFQERANNTCTVFLTFISSTNEGNPPIDIKVTKPKTKDAHAPLAYTLVSQEVYIIFITDKLF